MIENALNKFSDAYISFENFETLKRGTIESNGKTLPYVIFSSKIKNIPFKTIKGTAIMHSTNLIYSIDDKKAFNFNFNGTAYFGIDTNVICSRC